MMYAIEVTSIFIASICCYLLLTHYMYKATIIPKIALFLIVATMAADDVLFKTGYNNFTSISSLIMNISIAVLLLWLCYFFGKKNTRRSNLDRLTSVRLDCYTPTGFAFLITFMWCFFGLSYVMVHYAFGGNLTERFILETIIANIISGLFCWGIASDYRAKIKDCYKGEDKNVKENTEKHC